MEGTVNVIPCTSVHGLSKGAWFIMLFILQDLAQMEMMEKNPTKSVHKVCTSYTILQVDCMSLTVFPSLSYQKHLHWLNIQLARLHKSKVTEITKPLDDGILIIAILAVSSHTYHCMYMYMCIYTCMSVVCQLKSICNCDFWFRILFSRIYLVVKLLAIRRQLNTDYIKQIIGKQHISL